MINLIASYISATNSAAVVNLGPNSVGFMLGCYCQTIPQFVINGTNSTNVSSYFSQSNVLVSPFAYLPSADFALTSNAGKAVNIINVSSLMTLGWAAQALSNDALGYNRTSPTAPLIDAGAIEYNNAIPQQVYYADWGATIDGQIGTTNSPFTWDDMCSFFTTLSGEQNAVESAIQLNCIGTSTRAFSATIPPIWMGPAGSLTLTAQLNTDQSEWPVCAMYGVSNCFLIQGGCSADIVFNRIVLLLGGTNSVLSPITLTSSSTAGATNYFTMTQCINEAVVVSTNSWPYPIT